MRVAVPMPEATSGIIPIFLYIGWMSFVNNGSLVANTADARIQHEPPRTRVFAAPILLARTPARRLPIGVMPMNAIE